MTGVQTCALPIYLIEKRRQWILYLILLVLLFIGIIIKRSKSEIYRRDWVNFLTQLKSEVKISSKPRPYQEISVFSEKIKRLVLFPKRKHVSIKTMGLLKHIKGEVEFSERSIPHNEVSSFSKKTKNSLYFNPNIIHRIMFRSRKKLLRTEYVGLLKHIKDEVKR